VLYAGEIIRDDCLDEVGFATHGGMLRATNSTRCEDELSN